MLLLDKSHHLQYIKIVTGHTIIKSKLWSITYIDYPMAVYVVKSFESITIDCASLDIKYYLRFQLTLIEV